MKAYGYAREINEHSFYQEPPLALADQYAAIQAFWEQHLVPAGYGRDSLEIVTDRADQAMTPLRQRPAGLKLFREVRRHDAIVSPRLALMFCDLSNFTEDGGRLHQRRTLLHLLDCPPLACADSGKYLLAVLAPVEGLRQLAQGTLSHERYQATAAKQLDGVHPVERGTRHRAIKRQFDAEQFYLRRLKDIEMMIHLREAHQWSLETVQKYLVKNKLCRYVRDGKKRYWRAAEMAKAIEWYQNLKGDKPND